MKMMKDKANASDKPVETVDTLLGVGTVLQGDLEFAGGLRVDGQIKGHVNAMDTNNGTLVLSETGVIEGNITVPHVVVNGTVKGNIISTGQVEMQSKAQITGDIHYKAVEMELGASLNGNLVCDPGMPAYDAKKGKDK